MNLHTSQMAFLVGLLAYFAVRGHFQRRIGAAGVKARRPSRVDRSPSRWWSSARSSFRRSMSSARG